MSFPSPFAGGAGPAGSAFTVPGPRRQDDADVEVVVLAGMPRVDLLPAAVAAGDRFRRLQLGLGAGLVLVLVGAAAATLVTGAQVATAEQELAVQQARTGQLQAEQAQYAEVPLLRAASAGLTEARDAALAQDVLWHRYTARLANQLPADLRLTSLSMQLGAAAAAPVDPAAPVVDAPLGGLVLSLEGAGIADSADLLDVLAATPGITDPWADSTTAAAEGGTTVQAHADLSSAALSGRYSAQTDAVAATPAAAGVVVPGAASPTGAAAGTDAAMTGPPAAEAS